MPPFAFTSSFQISMAMSAALPLPASGPVRLMPKPILSGCCAAEGRAAQSAKSAPANQMARRFIAAPPRFAGMLASHPGCVNRVSSPRMMRSAAERRRERRLAEQRRAHALVDHEAEERGGAGFRDAARVGDVVHGERVER